MYRFSTLILLFIFCGKIAAWEILPLEFNGQVTIVFSRANDSELVELNDIHKKNRICLKEYEFYVHNGVKLNVYLEGSRAVSNYSAINLYQFVDYSCYFHSTAVWKIAYVTVYGVPYIQIIPKTDNAQYHAKRWANLRLIDYEASDFAQGKTIGRYLVRINMNDPLGTGAAGWGLPSECFDREECNASYKGETSCDPLTHRHVKHSSSVESSDSGISEGREEQDLEEKKHSSNKTEPEAEAFCKKAECKDCMCTKIHRTNYHIEGYSAKNNDSYYKYFYKYRGKRCGEKKAAF